VTGEAEGLPFTTHPSHDDIDVFFVDQIAFLKGHAERPTCA